MLQAQPLKKAKKKKERKESEKKETIKGKSYPLFKELKG